MTSVDALIITALKKELDALLAVQTDIQGTWSEMAGDPPFYMATFDAEPDVIRIAAARLTRMGGSATSQVAERLIHALQPRCIAMCGVCAGHPDDTAMGDVVLAERVFQHDQGKQKEGGFQGDLWVHATRDSWLRKSQDLAGKAAYLTTYSEPTEDQGRWWFLERLLASRNPLKSTALSRYVPDDRRAAVLTRLRDELGYVTFTGGGFSLTDKGRVAVEEHLALHGTTVLALPVHVHVGPMASGNRVEADGTIWKRLADNGMRKTLAVEMEAAAIGQIAHDRSLPFVVAKGVMDHADAYKTDRFKEIAAKASAEILCRFLQAVHGTLP